MRAIVLLCLAACHAAPSEQPNEKLAVHGMLLFGDRRLYLSHLPLYHPPHDAQVILEVDMSADAAARYRADRAAHPDVYYTFVPEKFRLSQARDAGFHFGGDVVRGHFERGGEAIGHAEVTIRRVIRFQRLEAGAPKSLEAIRFGDAGEAYSAHVIGGRPDYDQVLQVAPVVKQVYLETGDLAE